MNIGLVVNARGKMCLVHDEPFEAPPLWVGYHVDRKRIEIIFDNGATFPIDWEATEEMDQYLCQIAKILIIRMEDKKPVEGYDTSFLRLCRGRTTNGLATLKDGSSIGISRDGILVLQPNRLNREDAPTKVAYDGLSRVLWITWPDGGRQALSSLRELGEFEHEECLAHSRLLFFRNGPLDLTATLWLPLTLFLEGDGMAAYGPLPRKIPPKESETISARDFCDGDEPRFVEDWETCANWFQFDVPLRSFTDATASIGSCRNVKPTDVYYTELPFWHDTYLARVHLVSQDQTEKLYIVFGNTGAAIRLDATNEPIYQANELYGLDLEGEKLLQYARFFFHFVRGQSGFFLIVERGENIPWLPQAAPEERNSVTERLTPLARAETHSVNTLIDLQATVLFKNSLFSMKISVAPEPCDVFDPELGAPQHFGLGHMKLWGEELLLEELNVKMGAAPSIAGGVSKAVTDADFYNHVLDADRPVLVSFWAEWCGPCRLLAPVLEEIASRMSFILLVTLNVDANPKTPSQYGIRSLPTLMLFRNGEVVATKIGAAPREAVQAWLNEQLRDDAPSSTPERH